jgi:hypothetical protein
MSASGYKRTSAKLMAMSAFSPKPDIVGAVVDVRL